MKNIFSVLAIVLGILGGSLLPVNSYGLELSVEIKNKLESGLLRLDPSMFNSGYTGMDAMKKLHDDNKWDDLVSAVLGKKLPSNIYYYFLGRAAEGFQMKAAAIKYYGMAANETDYINDCAKFLLGNSCAGLKLPDAVTARRAALVAMEAKSFRKWDIGQGPLLVDVVPARGMLIDDLLKIDPAKNINKGKFETDEEFEIRKLKGKSGYFVIVKVSTDDTDRCNSSYDNKAGIYKIDKCVIFSSTAPMNVKFGGGETFALANMIDRREIKTLASNSFYLDFDYAWTAEFLASREVAMALDDDMYAGIQFNGFTRDSSCSACERRARNESSAKLLDTLGKITNKRVDTSDINWKKEAFLSGSIEENWVHRVSPIQINRIILFRKSDMRVLQESMME